MSGGRRPSFADVVAIMARLRAPGGCPWDRQQTPGSLRPYLIEEAYETLEAIDDGSPDRLREELGDVLLQVVFHAQMAAERGEFTIDDVVAGLADKLIRRHPHVFGDARLTEPDAVLARWEEIKEEERAQARATRAAGEKTPDERDRASERPESALSGLPRTLPALSLAQQMQARASRTGFMQPDPLAVIHEVREKLDEIEHAAAAPREPTAGPLGEFLFAAVALAQALDHDAELTLREACTRFRERFARLEQRAHEQGRRLSEYTVDQLLALWRATR
jgi:tetrapyrrole methylase family protein/MazG family protein